MRKYLLLFKMICCIQQTFDRYCGFDLHVFHSCYLIWCLIFHSRVFDCPKTTYRYQISVGASGLRNQQFRHSIHCFDNDI